MIYYPPFALLRDILVAHASDKPDATAYTFLKNDEEEKSLSYRNLDLSASCIAAELLKYGNSVGNVLLLFPQGLEFIQAFLGCALAGFPAVPLSIPRAKQSLTGLERVAIDSNARIVLCTQAISEAIMSRTPEDSPLRRLTWIAVDQLRDSNHPGVVGLPRNPSDPVLLQYTSGSTGNPKGVVVSNESLLHNISTIYRLYAFNDDSKIVSWLPQFHDMGLIGSILQSLYAGFPCILLSPTAFIQKPYRWLKAISDYRGTGGGAPNFAYDLCVSRITEEEAGTLDLSSWQVAWTGAETIRSSTLSAFADRFGSHGFNRKAFAPCYGLAEGTLMVTGTGPYSEKIISVKLPSLLNGETVELLTTTSDDAVDLVSCGKSFSDQIVQIVDTNKMEAMPDLKIGEIMVKGSSVTCGYWQNPQATHSAYGQTIDKEPGFLRTGDLGFLYKGELFVVGRVKETLKINGRSLYAQDLEYTAIQSHPDLKANGGASFSVKSNEDERLILVCELRRDRIKYFDGEEIRKAVSTALSNEYEVTLHDIVLIKPATLPMTTSGKIQRLRCRELYLTHSLDLLYSSLSTSMNKSPTPTSLTHEELLLSPPTLRPKLLVVFLKSVVASLAECDPVTIDSSQNIQDLGLDSIRLVELKVRLDLVLGDEFPLERFVSMETIGELAKVSLEYLRIENDHEGRIAVDSSVEVCPGPPSPQDLVVLEKLNRGFFDYLLQLREQYGRVVRFVWGKQTFYMISEPDDFREIFIKRTEEFIRGNTLIGFRLITDLEDLFTTEGDDWKIQRELARPEFTRASIEVFSDTIPGIVLSYMSGERGGSESRVVELIDATREITMRVVLSKLLTLKDHKKVRALLEAAKKVDSWNVPFFYISADRINLAPDYYKMLFSSFDPLIYELIDQHIDHPEQYHDLVSSYLATDFVKALPKKEQRRYLRNIVFTLILAGFDSTGSGLFSTLYMLAKNPEKFSKVREELQKSFPDSQPNSKDLLNTLPYTYAVVNEALRLFPPLWFLGREATRETTFQGYSIAKGDFILASPYVIQRNPLHWRNPTEFIPERFLEKDVPTGAYIPFGVGPRQCVGKWMALYEIILATATLVRNYDFSVECDGEFELNTLFTLRPKDSFRATFTPRAS
jgi:acyl-CoA synthetase (AMP-forming)/AMP-acid ligase II/cytochrome P450/acyl carrier protein